MFAEIFGVSVGPLTSGHSLHAANTTPMASEEAEVERRKAAAMAVIEGTMTRGEAMAKFTLSKRQVKTATSTVRNEGPEVVLKPRGRPPRVEPAVETGLEKLFGTAADKGQGFTFASALVVANDTLRSVNPVAAEKPLTESWLHGFLGRHPTLKLRVAKTGIISRHVGFNRLVVNSWFDLAEPVLAGYPAAQVWNIDESGLELYHGGVVKVRSDSRGSAEHAQPHFFAGLFTINVHARCSSPTAVFCRSSHGSAPCGRVSPSPASGRTSGSCCASRRRAA